DLDGEAAAACDHIIDSEIGDITLIRQWLGEIEQIRIELKKDISPETAEKLQKKVSEIFQRLNPRWKQEKFIVERALASTKLLINLRPANANEILGIAVIFLEMRVEEALRIVKSIEEGRLLDLRQGISERNNDILRRIKVVGNNINTNNPNYKQALESTYGLINLRPIDTRARIKGEDPTDEPEFVGLCGLLGQVADKLDQRNPNIADVEFLLNRARKQIEDASHLSEFMIAFRKRWTQECLNGISKDKKQEAFFDVYKEFAKANNFVRGSPYLWAYFWRAAFLPYRIGKEKPRSINPVFEAVTCLHRIHQLDLLKFAHTRHIVLKEDVIRDKRLIRKAQPKTYQLIKELIEELGGEENASLERLSPGQRVRLLKALREDFSPDIFQAQEISGIGIAEALSEENAARAFLQVREEQDKAILAAARFIEECGGVPAAKNSPIKMVIFDWGNVINRYDMHLLSMKLAKHFGVSEEEAFTFCEARNTDENNPLYKYEHDFSIFEDDLVKGINQWFMERAPKPANNIRPLETQEFSEMFASIYKVESEIPETIALIMELKAKGYDYRILTNNCNICFSWLMKNSLAAKLFDEKHILSSHLTKIAKPSPASYRLAAGAHFEMQQCLFIDDARENVDGALKIGMNAVCFDTKKPGKSIEEIVKILRKSSNIMPALLVADSFLGRMYQWNLGKIWRLFIGGIVAPIFETWQFFIKPILKCYINNPLINIRESVLSSITKNNGHPLYNTEDNLQQRLVFLRRKFVEAHTKVFLGDKRCAISEQDVTEKEWQGIIDKIQNSANEVTAPLEGLIPELVFTGGVCKHFIGAGLVICLLVPLLGVLLVFWTAAIIFVRFAIVGSITGSWPHIKYNFSAILSGEESPLLMAQNIDDEEAPYETVIKKAVMFIKAKKCLQAIEQCNLAIQNNPKLLAAYRLLLQAHAVDPQPCLKWYFDNTLKRAKGYLSISEIQILSKDINLLQPLALKGLQSKNKPVTPKDCKLNDKDLNAKTIKMDVKSSTAGPSFGAIVTILMIVSGMFLSAYFWQGLYTGAFIAVIPFVPVYLGSDDDNFICWLKDMPWVNNRPHAEAIAKKLSAKSSLEVAQMDLAELISRLKPTERIFYTMIWNCAVFSNHPDYRSVWEKPYRYISVCQELMNLAAGQNMCWMDFSPYLRGAAEDLFKKGGFDLELRRHLHQQLQQIEQKHCTRSCPYKIEGRYCPISESKKELFKALNNFKARLYKQSRGSAMNALIFLIATATAFFLPLVITGSITIALLASFSIFIGGLALFSDLPEIIKKKRIIRQKEEAKEQKTQERRLKRQERAIEHAAEAEEKEASRRRQWEEEKRKTQSRVMRLKEELTDWEKSLSLDKFISTQQFLDELNYLVPSELATIKEIRDILNSIKKKYPPLIQARLNEETRIRNAAINTEAAKKHLRFVVEFCRGEVRQLKPEQFHNVTKFVSKVDACLSDELFKYANNPVVVDFLSWVNEFKNRGKKIIVDRLALEKFKAELGKLNLRTRHLAILRRKIEKLFEPVKDLPEAQVIVTGILNNIDAVMANRRELNCLQYKLKASLESNLNAGKKQLDSLETRLLAEKSKTEERIQKLIEGSMQAMDAIEGKLGLYTDSEKYKSALWQAVPAEARFIPVLTQSLERRIERGTTDINTRMQNLAYSKKPVKSAPLVKTIPQAPGVEGNKKLKEGEQAIKGILEALDSISADLKNEVGSEELEILRQLLDEQAGNFQAINIAPPGLLAIAGKAIQVLQENIKGKIKAAKKAEGIKEAPASKKPEVSSPIDTIMAELPQGKGFQHLNLLFRQLLEARLRGDGAAESRIIPNIAGIVSKMHDVPEDTMKKYSLALNYRPNGFALIPAEELAHCMHLLQENWHYAGIYLKLILLQLNDLRDASVEKLLFKGFVAFGYGRAGKRMLRELHQHFLDIPKERLLDIREAKKKKNTNMIVDRIAFCLRELEAAKSNAAEKKLNSFQCEILNALGFLYQALYKLDKNIDSDQMLVLLEKVIKADCWAIPISAMIACRLRSQNMISRIRFEKFLELYKEMAKIRAFVPHIANIVVMNEMVKIGEYDLVLDLFNRHNNSRNYITAKKALKLAEIIVKNAENSFVKQEALELVEYFQARSGRIKKARDKKTRNNGKADKKYFNSIFSGWYKDKIFVFNTEQKKVNALRIAAAGEIPSVEKDMILASLSDWLSKEDRTEFGRDGHVSTLYDSPDAPGYYYVLSDSLKVEAIFWITPLNGQAHFVLYKKSPDNDSQDLKKRKYLGLGHQITCFALHKLLGKDGKAYFHKAWLGGESRIFKEAGIDSKKNIFNKDDFIKLQAIQKKIILGLMLK
ncbi:MAG: HAD-IA family hydrolase, partial [Candidatus Omnitrophica bacterium]|nr:HAD-IA family hydrolase [Candidatus Omnitrophota bacterium]